MGCEEHNIWDRELRALRVLLDERTEANERSRNDLRALIDARLAGLALALEVKDRVIIEKFENTNNWRLQNDNERRALASKTQVEAIEKDMRRLEAWQSRASGAMLILGLLGTASLVRIITDIAHILGGAPTTIQGG